MIPNNNPNNKWIQFKWRKVRSLLRNIFKRDKKNEEISFPGREKDLVL